MKITNKITIIALMMFSFIAFTSCDMKKDKKETEAVEEVAVEEEVTKDEAEEVDHFATVDTDEDGSISKEEFMAHSDVEYKNKDKNEDGKIDKDECPMFDDMNTDGDDSISLEEFTAGHEAMFPTIDTDANGSISKEEMDTFMSSMMEEGKCGKADKESSGMKCEPGKCGGM